MKKLNVQPSECDCIRCSSMCHAPCCGTPKDFERLMDAGYGKRLMYDDLPGGATMLKPALKGYEGLTAPWKTYSHMGCTFWENGLCQLHTSGLKPSQGKLALHDQSEEDQAHIADFLDKSWKAKNAKKTLKRWKELYEKH